MDVGMGDNQNEQVDYCHPRGRSNSINQWYGKLKWDNSDYRQVVYNA